VLQEDLRGAFGGSVECDETMIGGKRKGKRGWGAAGKVIVLGILQRNGRVKVFAVPNRSNKSLIELIKKHTKPGSLYYTDDYQAYASLGVCGEHIVVKKTSGRPKGRDHINGIEGFWSYAKNWLYPLRGIPRKNFHLYMGEICWRFNNRRKDLYPLIVKGLRTTPADEIHEILVRFG
jgi:transposase